MKPSGPKLFFGGIKKKNLIQSHYFSGFIQISLVIFVSLFLSLKIFLSYLDDLTYSPTIFHTSCILFSSLKMDDILF